MSATTTRNAMLTGATTPQHVLRAVLAALNQGRIADAVEQFDDDFTFHDRALGLQLAEKGRLREFFAKSRELFPDTVVQVASSHESGDTAFAEWRLTATWPTYYVAVPVQLPISLSGASIARIENGRITYWSDYYDEKSSMRVTLAASLDWCEH